MTLEALKEGNKEHTLTSADTLDLYRVSESEHVL